MRRGPDDTSIRRLRARVGGRVQGVAFRASTAERAGELGLTGWVRNRPDGSVELEAQGTPEQLDALVAWCRRGPPVARVDAVDVDWIDPVEERGFRVRR